MTGVTQLRYWCPAFHVGNASFPDFWDPGADDITFCYQSILSSVAHAIFCVVGAFYLGTSHVGSLPHLGLAPKKSASLVRFTWILRLLSAFMTLASCIVSLPVQLMWLKDHQPFGFLVYVEVAIILLAWLLQSAVLWSFVRTWGTFAKGRDSCALFFSWFPVFAVWSLRFRSTVLGHSPNEVHRIIIISIFGLQLLHLLAIVLHLYSTCIFVGPPGRKRDALGHVPASVTTDSDEARLLNDVREIPVITANLGIPSTWGPVRSFLFLWVDPLMQYGAEGILKKPEDLFELPVKLKADQHAEVFQKALERNTKTSRFYLPQIIFKLWGGRWVLLGVMKLSYSFLQYCSPLFVNVLVSSIEDPGSHSEYAGYLYGLALITVNLVSSSVQLHYVFQVEQLSMRIRGALIDTVYNKLLRVHSSALSENESSGQLVNFVGTDCQQVSDNCQYLHQLWAMPLQVAVALYLLYLQVGFSFIGGVIFSVLLIPLNQFLASKISGQVEKNLKERDARVKQMGEILTGVRIIKFHAWEKWFIERVGAIRAREMRTVKTVKYLDAWCVYFWATTPLVMSVLTFVTYVSLGNQLTAAKVFTCLSVFGLVYLPLNAIPWIITGTVEAWISAKRLQKFFRLCEIDLKAYYSMAAPLLDAELAQNVVTVDGADFTWTEPSENTTDRSTSEISEQLQKPLVIHLEGISLEIQRGDLIGIIGKVGSGKSSLMYAIIAELYKLRGITTVTADILSNGFGFVAQDNWLQQGTIRSNVKFSSTDENPEFYRSVLSACVLTQDIDAMSIGDLTQIGEHGITLSGGQRARIALARAVYQDKDVIIMDDPLSAVYGRQCNSDRK